MTAQLTRDGTQDRTADGHPGQPRAAPERGHRIRLAVQEMNYASRRVRGAAGAVDVDEQWDRR